MSVLNLLGNSATICAGFVMYNIATFDSDVLRGPITSATLNFGLTSWGYVFLWANWISFALGMSVALIVLNLDERFRILDSDKARVAFVERIPFLWTPAAIYVVAMHAYMTAN